MGILIPILEIASQIVMTGTILDAEKKQPLPFVSIQIKGTNLGTISSEEGVFRLNVSTNIKSDTLVFSSLGFEKKKVPFSDLKKNPIVVLKPSSIRLAEVMVVEKDPKLLFRKFYSIIKKYRKSEYEYTGNVYFSLMSFSDSTPVEIVESFHNANFSKKAVLSDFEMKMGRFGHDNETHFYSLNTSDLAKNYDLYTLENTTPLPLWPGKMTLRNLKRYYTIEARSSKTGNYTTYSFVPRSEADFFSGNIIVDNSTNEILELVLLINEPKKSPLTPIDPEHKLKFEKLEMRFVYNSQNINHIKYITFNYDIKYYSHNQVKDISTESVFLLYLENNTFVSPIFTKEPNIRNDYERILAVGFDSLFWTRNYHLPLSDKTISMFEYLSKHGSIVNFEHGAINDSPKILNFSLIEWNKNRRIRWEDFNHDSKEFNIKENRINATGNLHAPSDLYNFDFIMMVNPIVDTECENRYVSKLFFNINESYYFLEKKGYELALANILFDMFYVEKLKLDSTLKKAANYIPTAEILSFSAKVDVEKTALIKKTNRGSDLLMLLEYDRQQRKILNTDNSMFFLKKKEDPLLDNESEDNSNYNIGTALLKKKDYIGAIMYLTKAKENATGDIIKDILYNRAIAFINLKDFNKARTDLTEAVALDDEQSKILLDEIKAK